MKIHIRSWYRSFSHPIKCTICWNTAHCPILFVFLIPVLRPKFSSHNMPYFMKVYIRSRYCSCFSSKFFIHEDRRPCPRLAPCLQVCVACKVCCAFFVWQSRAFALQITSWCFFLLCLWFPVISASRRVSEIFLLFPFLHFLAAFGVWTGKEKARSVSLVLGIVKRNSYC